MNNKPVYSFGGLYMNKKSKCVLAGGIAIFALTAIALIFSFIRDSNNITIDQIDQTVTYAFYIFVVSPILLEEIVLFRSVYRFVNVDLWGLVKICCIVSAILTFCALVFQTLVFTHVITTDIFPEGPRAASSRLVGILLLTEWPIIIVSFILGNVHTKAVTQKRLKSVN